MVLANTFLLHRLLLAVSSKVVDCFKMTVNSQKHYFQKQLKRNKMSRY